MVGSGVGGCAEEAEKEIGREEGKEGGGEAYTEEGNLVVAVLV